MNALDQSIIDLCERHNLASASVTHHRMPHGTFFHGSVQWLDDSKAHGRGIATHNGGSFADALNGAVAKMLAERGNTTIPEDAVELAA